MKTTFALCRLCVLGALFRALLAGLVADEPIAPALSTDSSAIALSPYEVTANKSEFDRWIKVTSPNFVIYSDARPEEAMALLEQMEMLRFTIQGFFGRRALAMSPMIVVLPTARSDWRKIQSKGDVEWKVAISGHGGQLTHIVLAQYDWQADGTGLIWSVLSRSTMSAMNFELEFWLRRGVGSFFETATFTKDALRIGSANLRTISLHTQGQMSWARFFEINAKSPEFLKDTSVMRQYDGQCAAFTQFMLANPDPIWMPRLLVWNALLTAGREPTEELFAEVFGETWKGWQKTMDTYLASGTFNLLTIKIPPSIRELPRRQLPLRTTEMRELFVLSQILNQDIPDSDVSLDALLARGLRTESLRELLVEACRVRKRDEATLDQLRVLIAQDSPNPRVHAAVASITAESRVPEPGIHARIDHATLEEMRSLCRRALDLEPIDFGVNTTLAWAEALAPEIDAASLEAIGAICRRLDGNGRTDLAIAALAVARWRAGRTESARVACQILLESPLSSENARRIATEITGELARAAPAAPGPTPMDATVNASIR